MSLAYGFDVHIICQRRHLHLAADERLKLISSELYQYLLPQAATEELIAQRPESEGKPADSADLLRFARKNLLK